MTPVAVDVRRHSAGRRISRARAVKRFTEKHASFRWTPRRLGPGYYVVGFRTRARDGSTDVRRVAVRRARGRFRRAPAIERRRSCAVVQAFALGRPVFGGRRGLVISVRLAQRRRAAVVVRRGRRVVKRFRARTVAPGRSVRFRLAGRSLARGRYRVTLVVGGKRAASLATRRL